MLRGLYTHRWLLWNFLIRDLRGRYAGSTIGLFWYIIDPLLRLIIYTFVFSILFKVKLGNEPGTVSFVAYLFCGLLPWIAFEQALQRSATAITDNSNLVRKVVFPSEILPTYLVFSNFIHQTIALILFLGILFIIQNPPGIHALSLPIVFLLQIIFTLGLAWFLSSLNIFFRDTPHVLRAILMIWFFATPIVYPSSIVPGKLKFLIKLNPMSHLVDIYRALLLENHLPNLKGSLFFLLVALASFVLGYLVFKKTKQVFGDLL
ncbi:Teichoic acid translocation permease protein TagG [subsurface metagenome]